MTVIDPFTTTPSFGMLIYTRTQPNPTQPSTQKATDFVRGNTLLMMKPIFSIFIKLLSIQYLSLFRLPQDFDFYFFVQQWPGAYCNTSRSCCYPKSGKPAADFGIHGLWPNNNDGSYPKNCDRRSAFNKSEISDLIGDMQKEWPTLTCPSNDGTKFWSHEWKKHGTCVESKGLDQHGYFEAALKLKEKANLLQILTNAGIEANDEFYDLESIVEAIKGSVGFTPGIQCNFDSNKNSQLFQIYLCVNVNASEFIECPLLRGKCPSKIKFAKF